MIKTYPEISIVIVNYKAEKFLPICLESIKNLIKIKYEVIIVDNNEINRGFAKAVNLGAKKAKGEYLLFLNPDTKITNGNFERLIEHLELTPKVGVVGLRMVLEDGSFQPYSFGKKLTLKNSIIKEPMAKGQGPTASPDWVSGGAMIIRKDLFENLDGFDERFFMYFEDQDLCLRAKYRGFEIELWKDIEIVHFGGKPAQGGGTGGKKRQLKQYYESQTKFLKKHYTKLYVLIFSLIRFPVKLIKTNF